jgi:phosphatidylethanolamine/phosphatidyl-N-methylethanolamine N-methyltransferase
VNIESVERVYSNYSGVYDLIFGKIFESGRETGIELLDIKEDDNILEVGVGTGLSLPCYPKHCKIVCVDLSAKMLKEAEKKIKEKRLVNVQIHKMDATRMEFEDNTFDSVMAAYFISTVPDPVKAAHEIKRVCKKGGRIVFLNHFMSKNKFISGFEKMISPVCCRIGFRTDLDLYDLLDKTELKINKKEKVNFFNYWKAVQCINNK